MTFFKITVIFFMPVASIVMYSCNNVGENNFKSPIGYNLNKPYLVKLPLELDEISGISYYEKDSSIFAISDDRGALFKIKPNIKIGKWKFSHGADFEEMTRIDSTFYILQSNGDIFKTNFEGVKSDVKIFNFPYNKNNEFETIYYDSTKRKLVLICKDCESDKKKTLTTYTFNPDSTTFSDSSFSINIKQIAELLDEKSLKFKPSAAAINPVDNLLYIISSVNKLLVVTDINGEVKSAFKINPVTFKQPEGITFSPSGDMIISNEFAETGTAELLIFKRNSK
jgi:uncharacterized protein YjiK